MRAANPRPASLRPLNRIRYRHMREKTLTRTETPSYCTISRSSPIPRDYNRLHIGVRKWCQYRAGDDILRLTGDKEMQQSDVEIPCPDWRPPAEPPGGPKPSHFIWPLKLTYPVR